MKLNCYLIGSQEPSKCLLRCNATEDVERICHISFSFLFFFQSLNGARVVSNQWLVRGHRRLSEEKTSVIVIKGVTILVSYNFTQNVKKRNFKGVKRISC